MTRNSLSSDWSRFLVNPRGYAGDPVKFYTINDVIIAASEFFYMEKEDLEFQMRVALSNLVAAKVSYRSLDN